MPILLMGKLSERYKTNKRGVHPKGLDPEALPLVAKGSSTAPSRLPRQGSSTLPGDAS